MRQIPGDYGAQSNFGKSQMGCNFKFDNYTSDLLTMEINNDGIEGHLNVNEMTINGSNAYINLNSNTTQKVKFHIFNNSTLIWSSVADTMHVSGFKMG